MKNLYKALAAFQQEVPNIYKNAKGYNYKFADLGKINDIIKPLLSKNGLGYSQPLAGNSVKTILYHVESGETLEGVVDIPQGVKLNSMNDFQVMGSAITYLRRYSLSSMLGLITDEDADAAGEQIKPKATKEIRNRTEEIEAGTEPMGVGDPLVKAKIDINAELVAQGYKDREDRTAFVKFAIGKETIDNIEDAHNVANALESQE